MSESNFTPQLEEVLKNAIEQRLVQLHTSMPGVIAKYDSQKQVADVRPAIKRKYSSGEIVELPLLTNVPVAHPRAGKARIHLPLKAGDSVEICFSERSLENWNFKGGIVDPEDPRKHHLSDAYVKPCLYPNMDPFKVTEPEAIEIVNDKAEIFIKADGSVSIKGKSILLGDHSLSEFVAIASKVKEEIEALSKWAATHTHIVSMNGPAGKQEGTAVAPMAPPPTVKEMGSAKVKVAT